MVKKQRTGRVSERMKRVNIHAKGPKNQIAKGRDKRKAEYKQRRSNKGNVRSKQFKPSS
jgi:hypothetical protein